MTWHLARQHNEWISYSGPFDEHPSVVHELLMGTTVAYPVKGLWRRCDSLCGERKPYPEDLLAMALCDVTCLTCTLLGFAAKAEKVALG